MAENDCDTLYELLFGTSPAVEDFRPSLVANSVFSNKAVEDTISDKCRTKIFNIRRGSREKLVKKVVNVFLHEI